MDNDIVKILLSVLVPAAVTLIINYMQSKRSKRLDDADLSEKYQQIAAHEVDRCAEIEKRMEKKTAEIEKRIEIITAERDEWKRLAEKFREELEKAERRIAELKKIIERLKGGAKWD